MQVSTGGQTNGVVVFVKCSVHVSEVVAITPCLDAGVQRVANRSTQPGRHHCFRVRGLTILPLLQFDDNRVLFLVFVQAGDHGIQPFRALWQLVLKKHAMISQLGTSEDERQPRKRLLPRSNFRG